MKIKLLISFLCITGLATAQNRIDYDTVTFDFTKVVPVSGINAGSLYSNAKLFIAKAFVSAKHVTQMDDANSNTIVTKGAFVIPIHVKGAFSYVKEFPARFTLQIRTKDGKYQYVMNDFFVDSPDNYYDGYNLSQPYAAKKGEINKKAHRALWDEMKKSAYEYTDAFISDMEAQMKKNHYCPTKIGLKLSVSPYCQRLQLKNSLFQISGEFPPDLLR